MIVRTRVLFCGRGLPGAPRLARQTDGRLQAHPIRPGIERDDPAVQLDGAADDGQAQARAGARRAGQAAEALEGQRPELGRNTGARVLHLDAGGVPHPGEAEGDPAALRRVPEGVGQEVVHGADEGGPVAVPGQAVRALVAQILLPGHGLGHHQPHTILGQPGQVEGRPLHRGRGGIQPGHGQELSHQLGRTGHPLLEILRRHLALVPVQGMLHHMGLGSDHRQGRAQLVGRIGDEAALGLEQVLHPGEQAVQGCDQGFGLPQPGMLLQGAEVPRAAGRHRRGQLPKRLQGPPREEPGEQGQDDEGHGELDRGLQDAAPDHLPRDGVGLGDDDAQAPGGIGLHEDPPVVSLDGHILEPRTYGRERRDGCGGGAEEQPSLPVEDLVDALVLPGLEVGAAGIGLVQVLDAAGLELEAGGVGLVLQDAREGRARELQGVVEDALLRPVEGAERDGPGDDPRQADDDALGQDHAPEQGGLHSASRR